MAIDASYPPVTAVDAVDGAVAVTCVPASPGDFDLGPTIVNCSASNAAGNVGRCSFILIVIDLEAPAITCPNNVLANTSLGANQAWNLDYPLATAVDAVDDGPLVTCHLAPGSNFDVGVTIVTCTASDFSHNENSCNFSVTVVDNEPPWFSPCPPIFTQATQPLVVTGVEAFDNVGVVGGVVCALNGTVLPLGITNVTCMARDAAGNVNTCSFPVICGAELPPAFIGCSDRIVASADGDVMLELTYDDVTAVDLFDGPRDVVCSPNAVPSNGQLVNCTSMDTLGNIGSCSFFVTVAWVTFDAVAPDNGVSPTDFLTNSPLLNVIGRGTPNYPLTAFELFANGSVQQLGTGRVASDGLYSATLSVPLDDGVHIILVRIDVNGTHANTSRPVHIVTRVDPPVLTQIIPDTGLFADDFVSSSVETLSGISRFGTRISVQAVQGTAPLLSTTTQEDGTWSITPASPLGNTVSVLASSRHRFHTQAASLVVLQIVAEDDAGNSAASAALIVIDTASPDINVTDVVLPALPTANGTFISYNASAADDYYSNASAVCTPLPGTFLEVGLYDLNCTSVDSAGNIAFTTNSLLVRDETPPMVFQCPPPIRVVITNASELTNITWVPPTAVDNVGVVRQSASAVPFSLFPLGDTPVIYTFTDAANLTSECVFIVFISLAITSVGSPGPPSILPPVLGAMAAAAGALTFAVALLWYWRRKPRPVPLIIPPPVRERAIHLGRGFTADEANLISTILAQNGVQHVLAPRATEPQNLGQVEEFYEVLDGKEGDPHNTVVNKHIVWQQVEENSWKPVEMTDMRVVPPPPVVNPDQPLKPKRHWKMVDQDTWIETDAPPPDVRPTGDDAVDPSGRFRWKMVDQDTWVQVPIPQPVDVEAPPPPRPLVDRSIHMGPDFDVEDARLLSQILQLRGVDHSMAPRARAPRGGIVRRPDLATRAGGGAAGGSGTADFDAAAAKRIRRIVWQQAHGNAWVPIETDELVAPRQVRWKMVDQDTWVQEPDNDAVPVAYQINPEDQQQQQQQPGRRASAAAASLDQEHYADNLLRSPLSSPSEPLAVDAAMSLPQKGEASQLSGSDPDNSNSEPGDESDGFDGLPPSLASSGPGYGVPHSQPRAGKSLNSSQLRLNPYARATVIDVQNSPRPPPDSV